MSASPQESRKFDVTWSDVNQTLSDGIRGQVPEGDLEAGEGEQGHRDMGVEEENITEKKDSGGNWTATTNTDSTRHTENLASRPDAQSVETEDIREDNPKTVVEFPEGNSEYDVGPEKEDSTKIEQSLDGIFESLDRMEERTVEEMDDGVAKRQGHMTGMINRGSQGPFDWDKFDEGEYPGWNYLTKKIRYPNFIETFGKELMPVSGTGSVQTTMRPKIYDEEHEGAVDEDKWISDFMGGGDRVGMPALSPLIYGPFQNSPIIDEETVINEEGEEEVRKIIETLNGRDKAYGEGFQTDWDQAGLGKTPEEYVTEHSKACYSPELAEIESWNDVFDFFADFEWQFSNKVKAENMKVVDEGETYTQGEEYDTLDDMFEFVDPDDAGYIRVGHEDWGPIDFSEFAEMEYFEGTIDVPDEEGNRNQTRVVVDYQDDDHFGDMDSEEYHETVAGHLAAHATAVWPSFRPRVGDPAIEYRDMCTNPFREAGIATQAGSFRRWREIQEFAEDELGIYEEDAQELRLGVNQEGFDYEIDEERGITLQEAWSGDHESLSYGMMDIVSEGVDEMTTGENYSVEQYQDTMMGTGDEPGIINNGLTVAEMTAGHHGVDVDGELLYDQEDVVVGAEASEQYAA